MCWFYYIWGVTFMNFYDWKIWLLNCYFECMETGDQRKIRVLTIWYTIFDFWWKFVKSIDFLRIFLGFCLSAWKLSLYVDEVAYRLPEKQNICSGFKYPCVIHVIEHISKRRFFPILPRIEHMFFQVVFKTMCDR